MLALALSLAVLLPGLMTPTAVAATPESLPLRQIIPAPIGPAPTPSSGGGIMPASPQQQNSSSSWRIADTGGIPARVRSAPSINATIVMRLDPGTEVSALTETATADGYQWRRISVDGATGWIATSLLLEPAAPAPAAQVYMVAAVGDRGLNLRESPSTASAVLASLQEGAVVTVLAGPREAEGRQWLQIRTGQNTGWVIAEAITQR